MDIALKQRLVGATILIALAVIFLPLLLDGENRDGRATQSIDIPDRPDVDFKTRRLPIGNHGQADQPENDAVQDSEWQEPQVQRPLPDKPVATPETREAAAPVIEKPIPVKEKAPIEQQSGQMASAGNWIVQVASFGSLDNANRLGADLERIGYAAMLEAGGSNGNTLIRVKIGPFNSESEAGKAAQHVSGAINGVSPRVLSTDGTSVTAAIPASGWVVQLGSFSATENAEKLTAGLRLQGFTIFTDKINTTSGTVFKVRTGAVAERTDAEQLRDRIRARSGTAGMVVNLAEQ